MTITAIRNTILNVLHYIVEIPFVTAFMHSGVKVYLTTSETDTYKFTCKMHYMI